MRKELWNGHEIRVAEKGGEPWFVAMDVCDALGIENTAQALATMPDPCICKTYTWVQTGVKKDGSEAVRRTQVLAISELGVYRLVMRSNKPEAEAFQDWVFGVIKTLREALGYEQWKALAFTESAAAHRIDMERLKEALKPADKVPYLKAHTITNRCMANILGEAKAIGKEELKERHPEAVALRDRVLADTVDLMALNERFELGLSVSAAIYGKYGTAA